MFRKEKANIGKINAAKVKRAQREAQRNEQNNQTPVPVIKVVENSAPKKVEPDIVTSVKVISDTTYDENLNTISAIYGSLSRNNSDLNDEEIVNTDVLHNVNETSNTDKPEAPEASRFANIKTTLAWLASMVIKVATSPFRAVWWALSAGASKVVSFFPRKKTSNVSAFSSTPVQIEANDVVPVITATISNEKKWKCFTPFRKAKMAVEVSNEWFTPEGELNVYAVPVDQLPDVLQSHKDRPVVI